VLDLNAQPAARDAAVGLQRVDDRFHRRSRNREADADAAAGRREDRRVHADDPAADIEGRTAGISAVDWSVDLDVVRIRTTSDIAPQRGDDAGRDRAAEAERIADRDDPIAHSEMAFVAERHG